MSAQPEDPYEDLSQNERELVAMLQQDALNRAADGDPGALKHSMAFRPQDPAFFMLLDGKTSKPQVHRPGCYICEDPEFAVMGLPLCRPCPRCGGHIAADDEVCDDCGHCDNPYNQGASDGLAPDGFPEAYFDDAGDQPLCPYGDFETREPFRFQVGTNYDGSPAWFGDYREPQPPHVFVPGDLAETATEEPYWSGIVVSDPLAASGEVAVRVGHAEPGCRRSPGDVVYSQPEFLNWSGHVYGDPGIVAWPRRHNPATEEGQGSGS